MYLVVLSWVPRRDSSLENFPLGKPTERAGSWRLTKIQVGITLTCSRAIWACWGMKREKTWSDVDFYIYSMGSVERMVLLGALKDVVNSIHVSRWLTIVSLCGTVLISFQLSVRSASSHIAVVHVNARHTVRIPTALRARGIWPAFLWISSNAKRNVRITLKKLNVDINRGKGLEIQNYFYTLLRSLVSNSL